MDLTGYVDVTRVREALGVLVEPGQVFEVRGIGTTGRKVVVSGYFKDADTLLRAMQTLDLREKNFYITLGKVKDYCFAKAQSGRFLQGVTTTDDKDIERYRWLFVDFDPIRPADISSTDAELQAARELADKVRASLRGRGWPEPVAGLSGNGYHLLYRINIGNDQEGRALVERCLKALAMLYSNGDVKVDTTNYNPARICKLPGTLAQKGSNVPERPHRMSRLMTVPESIEAVPLSLLRDMAAELPEAVPDPPKRAEEKPRFDIVDFMARHGLSYRDLGPNDRASAVYALDACPFNSNHRNGDAKIFSYPDGRVSFRCHHDSCSGYKWQDVRLLFEPDAYDKQEDDWERYDRGWLEHVAAMAAERAVDTIEEKRDTRKAEYRQLKTAEELMQKDIPEPRVFVGVGDEVPLLVEGTCILSAKPKLGKSWLALAMCVAVANGADFLGRKTRRCSTLYLDLETGEALQQKRLRKVLAGDPAPKNFYLERETDGLSDGFIDQIEDYLRQDPDIGIVVVDVFQLIRSTAKSIKETEYEHAYRDLGPLNDLAQRYHISIVLVCHDRKAVDPDDPFSNILGSTGLQGAATQMMVMFRKRKEDPIHISIKGKTIDGLPELNVRLDNAQWRVVGDAETADNEKAAAEAEYSGSEIRTAVLTLAERYTVWRGRCGTLIQDAIENDVAVTDSPKAVGIFLHRHQGRFLAADGIKVTITSEGTASKTYTIQKSTIGTIGNDGDIPLGDFEECSNNQGLDVPFL